MFLRSHHRSKDGKQHRYWSRVETVLAIHRLCAPGSELAIEERWYPDTALDDLLGIEESKLKEFERELTETGWEQVRPEVEVKMVSTPGGEETYILCRATARWQKEKAIRPVFHQLERRVKAHVLVAFLGYALWVTLKHLLRRKDLKISPAQALSTLSGLRSADIILPTTEGREIRLRRITTPTEPQRTLLQQLDLQLLDKLKFDYECSADSEVG